jgi:hypothetical protein
MAFFKRDKETPAQIENGAKENVSLDPIYAALRDRFRQAKYGDNCRTLPFAHPSQEAGTSEWLKAYEDPMDRSWHIFTVQAENNYLTEDAPQGRAAHFHKPFATGLTMFDMVRRLSEYEASQRKLGFVVTEEIADKLGAQYYRSFAEREGIIFDLRAQEPHPTLNGMIATTGHFAPDAESTARKAFAERPDIASFERGELKLDFNDAQHEDALAALIESFKKAEKYKDFLRDLESIQAIIVDYYDKDYNHRPVEPAQMARLFKMTDEDFAACQKEARAATHEQKERGYNFSGFCFYRLMKRAEKTLRETIQNEGQLERILPELKKQELYFELFRANAYSRLICENHPASEELADFQRDALYRVDKIATVLNYDDAEIMTLKKLASLRAPLAVPQALTDFLARAKKIPQQFEEQIEAQRARFAGPRP